MSGYIIQCLLAALAAIAFAPVAGGLLSGLDRKITARIQNRYGPPVLQPFYDFFKLMGKENIIVNQTQALYVLGHLFFSISGLVMLVLGQDLLMLVFVLAFSTISLIMGAMSVHSPYSKMGAYREIMQLMAYEPVLLMMAGGLYLTTKSFMIQSIFSHGTPLLFNLPVIFLAYIYVLTIKLRKSPFDFSTSRNAHQELAKGLTTEFSGGQLAIIELTHWYDTVILLGLAAMFYAKPLWVGILIALAGFFLQIVIDNISTRLSWKWMLKATWIMGAGASLSNIIWLYLKRV